MIKTKFEFGDSVRGTKQGRSVGNDKSNDAVNHPAHYAKNGENECIEVMRWLFGDEAVKAYCRCNIFKYRFRSNLKNGQEDIEKSVWYENYLHDMLLENNHAD